MPNTGALGTFGPTSPISGAGPVGPTGPTGPVGLTTKSYIVSAFLSVDELTHQIKFDVSILMKVGHSLSRGEGSILICDERRMTIEQLQQNLLRSFIVRLGSDDEIIIKLIKELVDFAGITGTDAIVYVDKILPIMDEFNERLGVMSLTNIMNFFDVRNRFTYEQAKRVIDEYFVCFPIHDL
jgi:hypothetical protein